MLVLFFLVGIVQDVLAASYIRSVQKKRKVVAPLLGGVITFAAIVIWRELITDPDSLPYILALCAGNAVGTRLVLNRS